MSKGQKLSAMDKLISSGISPAISQNDPKAKLSFLDMSNTKPIEVDPNICRLWKYADRPVSETEHKEILAKSFQKESIGQIQPAIVRPIDNDQKHRFEIICGHVRWLAAIATQRKLLVAVREMNDQEAYIIMQAENRERKDISDYAWACSYKRALDNELFKTRTELAEMERLSNSVISYYLGFAGLSQEVVKEFNNISLIGYRVGYEIAKACEILGDDAVIKLIPKIEAGKLGKDEIRHLYEFDRNEKGEGKIIHTQSSTSIKYTNAEGESLFTFKKGAKGSFLLFSSQVAQLVDDSLLEKIKEVVAVHSINKSTL